MRVGISYAVDCGSHVELGCMLQPDPGKLEQWIVTVPKNVARCAIGESDLEYLLGPDSGDMEHFAFSVSYSEFQEFLELSDNPQLSV